MMSFVGDALAPIAGLFGVLVGAWLTSRSEEKHWVQRLRLDAYLEVDRLTRLVLYRGDDIGKNPSESDIATQRASVRNAMMDLRTAVSRVSLISDLEVRRSAQALLSACTKGFDYYMQTGVAGEDVPEITEMRAKLVTFQEAAQADMGLTKDQLHLGHRKSVESKDRSIISQQE